AAALEKILRKECGVQLSLSVIEVKRNVYVLSGNYATKPLKDRPKDLVEIYASELTDRSIGGGGSGSLEELASNLEAFVVVPVILGDVSGSPRRVEWHFNARVPATDKQRMEDTNPESVMKHVTEQTGLTVRREVRKIAVLTIKGPIDEID